MRAGDDGKSAIAAYWAVNMVRPRQRWQVSLPLPSARDAPTAAVAPVIGTIFIGFLLSTAVGADGAGGGPHRREQSARQASPGATRVDPVHPGAVGVAAAGLSDYGGKYWRQLNEGGDGEAGNSSVVGVDGETDDGEQLPLCRDVISTVDDTVCEPGHIPQLAASGDALCVPCPAGTFLPVPGTFGSECQECPKLHHSAGGAAACTTCPTDGVECEGTLHLLPGYWHDQSQVLEQGDFTDAVQFVKCSPAAACIVSSETWRGNISVDMVSCARGYGGARCAVCSDGFGASGTTCSPCESGTISILFLVLLMMGVIGAALVAVVRVLRIKQKFGRQGGNDAQVLSSLKILFNFLQMTSFLADFDLDWPSTLRSLFNAASVVSGFGVNTSFIDCALQWNLYDRFLVFFTLPFLVVIIPFLLLQGWVANERRKYRQLLLQDPALPERCPPLLLFGATPRSLYITLVMLYFFLLYPTTTREVFKVLSCTTPIAGTRYLSFDYSLQCDTADHATFSALAWVTLCMVSLGFPIVSASLLFRKRNILNQRKVQRQYIFLYSGYTPKAYYWESVIMWRKFAMVSASSLLSGNENGHQLYVGIWIVLVSLLLHVHFKPFLIDKEGTMEYVALVASLFSLLGGQLFALGGISDGLRDLIIFTVSFGNVCVIVWLSAGIVRALYGEFARTSCGRAVLLMCERKVDDWELKEKLDRRRSESIQIVEAAKRKLSTSASDALARITADRVEGAMLPDFKDKKLPTQENPLFRGKGLDATVRDARMQRRQTAANLFGLSAAEARATRRAAANAAAAEARRRSESKSKRSRKTRRSSVAPGRQLRSSSVIGPAMASTRSVGSAAKAAGERASASSNATRAKFRGAVRAVVLAQSAGSGEKESKHLSEPAAAEPPEELPREEAERRAWEARRHPLNGMVYYVNSMTGEQSWEVPEGLEEEAMNAVAQSLPPGWESRLHPTAKITYYTNTLTGQVQWEVPTEAAAGGAHV